jgi:hypothetical protein
MINKVDIATTSKALYALNKRLMNVEEMIVVTKVIFWDKT